MRAASPPAFRLVPDVRRIAVLRANGIGDWTFCLPALDALRAAYPAAEIVLLGARWHAAFLRDRPGAVDRVVVVPPTPGVNEVDGPPVGEGEREAFCAGMREERFDLALQLHGGGGNSNPFLLRLGARVTAGSRSEVAPALDRWLRYVYFQGEVARYVELVGLVGAEPVGLEPRVAVKDADLRESVAVVPEGAPIAVVHPGASDERRRWPPARFAEVGDALAADGLRVAVVGVGAEREDVQGVVAAMRADALELVDALSLGGLAGLMHRAAIVVGNDSGPLHLGHAVGAATVGVYWVGNLVNGAEPFRARHRPYATFRTACPVCGEDCVTGECEHRVSFVADVDPAAVLEGARDLLATTAPTAVA